VLSIRHGINQAYGVTHGHEPVLVQAFVAKASVEALNVGVLHRLARGQMNDKGSRLRAHLPKSAKP
jgi:hypothetical protein